jgi:hypothetical protein
MYKADPNDSTKQVPNSPNHNADAYTIAKAPAAEAEVNRASYVIINVENATKYEFLYETGGSYVDYGIVAADGPVRVDIQPIAWKGGDGTTGHVTFVYQGGLF